MLEQQSTFRDALLRHYKGERNRCEECLGDIIHILGSTAMLESDQVEQILARLTKHYNRDPQ